jgi:hypothetical protein
MPNPAEGAGRGRFRRGARKDSCRPRCRPGKVACGKRGPTDAGLSQRGGFSPRAIARIHHLHRWPADRESAGAQERRRRQVATCAVEAPHEIQSNATCPQTDAPRMVVCVAAATDNCPQPSANRRSVYTRTLHRACENVGNASALARMLRVPLSSLVRWMEGVEEPPDETFLAAVDIALSPPPAANQ